MFAGKLAEGTLISQPAPKIESDPNDSWAQLKLIEEYLRIKERYEQLGDTPR